MLVTHFFEELELFCSREAGVAIHAVERKGLKLLPALRAMLGGERLTILAWTPGQNSTPGATPTGPKTRAIAAGTLGALVPEAGYRLRIGVPWPLL